MILDLSSTKTGENENREKNLGRKDGGNAQGEFCVLGLVAEQVHSGQGADAAAQEGRADQGLFRDAPAVISGFMLVHKHKYERCCIN